MAYGQLKEYAEWSGDLASGPRDGHLDLSNAPRIDAIRSMVNACLDLSGYLTLKNGYTGDNADYYSIRAGLRLVIEAMERRDRAKRKPDIKGGEEDEA